MNGYDLENIYTYHPPVNDNQLTAYAEVRRYAKAMAGYILDVCPISRERSLALTKIEECVGWANAAIARYTPPE